ncbi:MAG: hypothetical protein HQM15_07010 [Deltaproteobacteria bacterium]|nr:hypothetical protein [Deltaproteobacteria bacterium]
MKRRILSLGFVMVLLGLFAGCKPPGPSTPPTSIDEAFSRLHAAQPHGKNQEDQRVLYNTIVWEVLADPRNAELSRSEELFEVILAKGLANEALALYVLSQPKWFHKPKAVEWAMKIVHEGGKGGLQMLQATLATDLWANEQGAELARFAIGRKVNEDTAPWKYCDSVLALTLKSGPWQAHPDLVLELVERMILTGLASPQALTDLLKAPALANNPKTAVLLDVYADLLAQAHSDKKISLGDKARRYFRLRTVTK